MLLAVSHTVRDYEPWKRIFDGHAEVRVRHGITWHRVTRAQDDPNRVTVICHFPDRAHADAFVADPSLAAAMQEGGVTSEPRIEFLDLVEDVSY